MLGPATPAQHGKHSGYILLEHGLRSHHPSLKPFANTIENLSLEYVAQRRAVISGLPQPPTRKRFVLPRPPTLPNENDIENSESSSDSDDHTHTSAVKSAQHTAKANVWKPKSCDVVNVIGMDCRNLQLPENREDNFWIVTHLVLLDLHSLPLICFVRLPCVGKRKTREPEDPFENTTESLTNRNTELDKFRKDLWITTVKQLNLVQLIRNEIPDCNDSDARKFGARQHRTVKASHSANPRLLEDSFDHSIQLYKKRRLALRSPATMAQRRGRTAERPSPNPRPRQRSRTNAPDDSEASWPASRSRSRASMSQGAARANAQANLTAQATSTGGQDTLSMQQLLLYLTRQQQQYQAQIQAQMQAQMQQANERFEFLVASRGEQKRKDPPVYEGRFGEGIELWIFSTEQYYANRRHLMAAESSDFGTLVSSNLGKSVLNWFRALSQTAKKIEEESLNTLQEAIDIASNFEFAHYSGRPPRVQSNSFKPVPTESGHRANKSRPHKAKRFEKKNDKNDDWTKTAACKNGGVVGHISPQCKAPK
ncbi:unnamed protein product [Phytophthora fragariaefolia]|uniref:Unnamed protein product n=1 Tax=Phytophthora fragariaefolia TaxID=1490495 RepID=A0A9W6XUN3_9STRA|nr:unnamed protein product [Phytophthora fragariaefolia]